jgi:hypothetical protein
MFSFHSFFPQHSIERGDSVRRPSAARSITIVSRLLKYVSVSGLFPIPPYLLSPPPRESIYFASPTSNIYFASPTTTKIEKNISKNYQPTATE